MKKWLKIAGIAILAFLLVFAVIAGKGGQKETKSLMVFKFNNGAEPETLDPSIMSGVPEFRIAMQIFEGLTVYNPKDLSPMPGVAESWDISDDGLVYTFHLRKDAKWSDGIPVTAKDFKYAWTRALAPETASPYAYQLWYIKNGEKYTEGKAKPEDLGIEVVDDYTLKVTLENPTPFFIGLTAFQTYMPTPKHVIDKVGVDKWYLAENIVCNGPFKLVEWKPQQEIVLVKNDTYWDKDKVNLDKIIIYPVEDDNTALEMYLNGEVDWITGVPVERMDEMKKHPDFHVAPYLGTYYYKVNVTGNPPSNKALTDPRVRKALALTINRKYICEYIGKAGQVPAYSYVPSNMPGYKGYKFADKEDPELARKLLAEAGYPNGEGFPTITILYNTSEGHKKIAEAIQQMWKKELNINVELENQEWKVYLNSQRSLNYMVSRSGWIGDYVDPNTFLDMYITNGGNNNTGWSNAEYDALIEKAKQTTDNDKRMEYFYQAEKILMTELPVIPIYFYVNVYMLKPYVKGIYENILDMHPLKEVYIEKAQ